MNKLSHSNQLFGIKTWLTPNPLSSSTANYLFRLTLFMLMNSNLWNNSRTSGMDIFDRKTLKLIFTMLCTIVVIVMVGYWLYKYEVEDRDIGVVDYTQLQDTEEVEYPVVSLCLKDPFLDEKLSSNNSGITRQIYLKYLEGELYDDTLENIEYTNVTLDLNQYFLMGDQVGSINHIEMFNGFYKLEFVKCFMIKYNGKDQRKIKELTLTYDLRKLPSDWHIGKWDLGTILISAHYPGQFFLENEFRYMDLATEQHAIIRFKELEILKRRNSRRRKCLEVKDQYDDFMIDQILIDQGCRVPYLKGHKSYPKCDDKEKIMNSLIDTQARQAMKMLKACERISKIRIDFESWSPQYPQNQEMILGIEYPEEVKVITQSKDVDIHSLIGNIGGYLGLFLGNKFIMMAIHIFIHI